MSILVSSSQIFEAECRTSRQINWQMPSGLSGNGRVTGELDENAIRPQANKIIVTVFAAFELVRDSDPLICLPPLVV
jgi:hypothetical protein